MNYYVIWYEDSIERDLVRDEDTNKMILFLNKDKAQEIASSLATPYRTFTVESHIMRYVDKNFYIIVD